MYHSLPYSTEQLDETVAWWENLKRPALSELIETALTNNQSIEAAYANLEQALAILPQTRSQALPLIDITGNSRQVWEGSQQQRATASASADLSWNIDVFNRIGAALEADRYRAVAAYEDLQALRLFITAEIARSYFDAVTAKEQIALLKQQIRLDEDLLEILELRLENGLNSSVEVLQQRARIAEAQTALPLAQADLAVFENRLDVLLGTAPDGQPRTPLLSNLKLETPTPHPGLPVALLINRPDLRAQYARLIAADAEIAEAIANRLPQLNLSAGFLFEDGAGYTGPASFLATRFIQPLLDWGARKAEVERNQSLYREELAIYTQNFLEAVEDVEAALIREDKQREFLRQLTAREQLLSQTVDETETRYLEGVGEYLDVISALKELRRVERDIINAKRELIILRISLYEAMGGPLSTIKD